MSTTTESVRRDSKKALERVFVRAYLSAQQSNLTGNAWNKINLNLLTQDLGGNFNTATYKFVVPVTGLYHIIGTVLFTNTVADKRYLTAIYNNGASIVEASGHASFISSLSVIAEDYVFLQADDEIELYAQPESGGGVDTVDVSSGSKATMLIINLLTKEGIRQ